LIQAGVPFSGVAVVIGINDAAALHEKLAANSTDSTGALNRMIQSMLRPEDFACQSSEEEFVLLYPAESGPSAQRRLFQVSEKLWDFQLRSLGHLSVMFSWGGLEVQNEKLGNAVESARERMQQTRRNRKSSPLEAAGGRRLVANG
jgi:GGDEF domain-containing protein